MEEKLTLTPELAKKLNAIDTKEGVQALSDEELDLITSNLTLTDEENRTIIFRSKDEAIIYAAQLQRNYPQIRFCKFSECFSINFGMFFTIEPMTTEKSNEDNFDFNSANDFVYSSDIILMAIVEKCQREKATAETESVVKETEEESNSTNE